jgi:4-hydroxy-tetrahydrodipicolinate reductase
MGWQNCTLPCAPDFEHAETDVDCVVDFSHHSTTEALLAFGKQHKLPLVIATTGQTDEERAAIEAAAKEIPIFFAANFSVGVALLIELAKKAAAAMPDAEIEIIEKHHDRKVDAPSGTALAIARAIQTVRPEATLALGRSGMGKRTKEEIGIHAVRMGNLAGEHEVLIGTNNQTITLKHETHSRALFAEGALAAAQFLIGKPAGLYDMNSMLSD